MNYQVIANIPCRTAAYPRKAKENRRNVYMVQEVYVTIRSKNHRTKVYDTLKIVDFDLAKIHEAHA